MIEKFIAKEKGARRGGGIVLIVIGVVLLLLSLVYVLGDEDRAGAILFIVMGAVLFGLGIFLFSRGIKSSAIALLLDYVNNSENPELKRREIEQFYQCTPSVHGTHANDQYIMRESNGRLLMFYKTSTVIWVYISITQHYYGIIPVGKSYYLVIGTTDGKQTPYVVNGKRQIGEIFAFLQNSVPYLIYGRNKEIDTLFKNNRQALMNTVIANRNEMLRYTSQQQYTQQ